MTRPLAFQRQATTAAALRTWHGELQQDLGGRARLRRAATPLEVSFEPAYHRLMPRDSEAAAPREWAAVAAVAGLAARVDEHVGGTPVPRRMAEPAAGGNRPLVSESRFRRLLAAEDLDERYAQLARIVHMLDRRLDLLSLADAAYSWDPQTRQQWAYDYYSVAPLS